MTLGHAVNPSANDPRYGGLCDAVSGGQFVLATFAACVLTTDFVRLLSGEFHNPPALPHHASRVYALGAVEVQL